MAAESSTTTETKGSNNDEVNLKENGDPQHEAPEEVVPAKKRGGDEEASEPTEGEEGAKNNLDDDQNVENPAYIPKTGRFYMHDDDRRGDVVVEEQDEDGDDFRRNLKKSRADGEWKHDRFDEKFQRPKTKKQIVTKYGFDIRHKEGDALDDGVESTEEESSDARVVRPQKDRRVPSKGKNGQRRPMKQREREDTVDESEGRGDEEKEEDNEARPAQKRQLKQAAEQKRKTNKPAVQQSSEDNEEDDEEESGIRRGQRRAVPLRRGTSGVTSRLRGRMSHPMPPRRSSLGQRPASSSSRSNPRGDAREEPVRSNNTTPRREYHNENRNDDRFENHRRGVIRGASRGVGGARGYSRGVVRGRGGDRGGVRYQGTRRTDTSEQSEGHRGSGTDYSSPRPTRGNSYPSTSFRGAHPSGNVYPSSRGGYQYEPRGNYHGPPGAHAKRGGFAPPMGGGAPMVQVAVPPPQMTRGTTHGHGNHGNHGNNHQQQQRIRQPTDVVYFDPQQQQGNRQLPQRSKKVIPIVDPNKADQK